MGMMGILRKPNPDKRKKPWNPFADVEEGAVAAGGKAKGFCDTTSSVPCITVCAPKGGCSCGCDAVRKALKHEIDKQELGISIGDAKTGCSGSCKHGPFLGFPQKGFFYLNVRTGDVPEIVQETLVNGRILFPLVSVNPDRSYRSDIYYEKSTGLLAGIDDRVCMVDAAKYFMDFEEGLSCGKCIPCRLGMKRMQEDMEKIVAGKGTAADLEEIETLCKTMITTPHCEFAMTSSRPVLSAITHFKDEFMAHIEGGACAMGVCKSAAASEGAA